MQVVSVLVDPRETTVSKKGKESLFGGFSVLNWIWGSLKLKCWRT